jgi:ribosomal-protein-alanine N-acetyltransferase
VGERTLLRAGTAADWREYRAVMRRSATHLRPWMPRRPGRAMMGAAEVFRRLLDPAAAGGAVRFLICARDDGRIVGSCSIGGAAPWPSLACHIGYWLDANETGKGYMRDAIAALVDHAVRDRRLHRVVANIMPHNARSRAVVRALGFRREGLLRGLIQIDGAWRDHECWAILADEWRARARRAATSAGAKRPAAAKARAGRGRGARPARAAAARARVRRFVSGSRPSSGARPRAASR